MRLLQTAVILGLLTALLWGGVVGCAALTQPPGQSLEQWQRDDAAVRSSGN